MSDRSLRDKRTTLADAATLVQDGHHVAVGGCLFSRTPIALLREILRRQPRRLELSRNLTCYEGDLFMAAGCLDKLVTSWMGIGLRWGVSKVLRHYVESGEVEFEEWSHLALGLRYRAAAMGLPFLPTRSMLGSDLMRNKPVKEMLDPFTGELLCLVPALKPDVAVIHVHRADRYGNGQIDGYPHMDADICKAAERVILSAEKLVDPDELKRQSDHTIIPFFTVDAVVEAPYGSFPHECWGLYDADMEAIGQYADAVATDGPYAAERWLQRWVFEPPSFTDYLSLFGENRIENRRLAALELLA